MDIKIKHKFVDADSYRTPVVLNPISSDVFIQHLKDGIKAVFASKRKTYRNAQRMYANMMGYYLKKFNITQVNPDEDFFDDLTREFYHTDITMNHSGNCPPRRGKLQSVLLIKHFREEVTA